MPGAVTVSQRRAGPRAAFGVSGERSSEAHSWPMSGDAREVMGDAWETSRDTERRAEPRLRRHDATGRNTASQVEIGRGQRF